MCQDMFLHSYYIPGQLVVISDPHIKIDPDWSFYCEAKEGAHAMMTREGGVYEGTCWPGKI